MKIPVTEFILIFLQKCFQLIVLFAEQNANEVLSVKVDGHGPGVAAHTCSALWKAEVTGSQVQTQVGKLAL